MRATSCLYRFDCVKQAAMMVYLVTEKRGIHLINLLVPTTKCEGKKKRKKLWCMSANDQKHDCMHAHI